MGLLSRLRDRFRSLDRRRARRIDVDMPTDFAQDEDEVFLFHQTINISRTGAYIRSDEPFDAGSPVEIVFSLLSGEDFDAPTEKIRIAAEVVYAIREDQAAKGGRPKGMGVRFSDLSDHAWERIESWIVKAAESVEPVVGVSVAERVKMEQIGRFQPELKSEVDSFAWDAPDGEGAADDDAIPDETLIAEIEERMRTERPGLKAVREGDPPPRKSEAGLEVRRDGTIEAKRAQEDLGLVSRVEDESDESD